MCLIIPPPTPPPYPPPPHTHSCGLLFVTLTNLIILESKRLITLYSHRTSLCVCVCVCAGAAMTPCRPTADHFSPSHIYPGYLLSRSSVTRCIPTTCSCTLSIKPVLNWVNVCSPEHTSDTSMNYDSFLNWTFSSPNMVRTVQTLLHSQLACNEMQASARTCGRRAADSMIENVG